MNHFILEWLFVVKPLTSTSPPPISMQMYFGPKINRVRTLTETYRHFLLSTVETALQIIGAKTNFNVSCCIK